MNQKEKEEILRQLSPEAREYIPLVELLIKLDNKQMKDFYLASRCSLVEKKLTLFDLDKNNEYHALFQRLKSEFQEHESQLPPVTPDSDSFLTEKAVKEYEKKLIRRIYIYYGMGTVLGILTGIIIR